MAQALENTMKNGNHKIVIKASAREIIKKRAIDALLAEIYKQGGTNNVQIFNAVERTVDTLLREFRRVCDEAHLLAMPLVHRRARRSGLRGLPPAHGQGPDAEVPA